MSRLRIATIWLGGCSGCHMSFLDLDEWLIELAARADLVYSPIADAKHFPAEVDLTLIEGAIASDEHRELAKTARRQSKCIVSFGDCAVTGNVTALRNPLGPARNVLQQVYVEHSDPRGVIPHEPGIIPLLLDKVVPVHQVIPVDYYLSGCPPSASRIRALLEALLEGREPLVDIRYG
ncbi:oxidoreductase [Chloroflexus sp. MS-CIW-1]|jgi:NAD-reducing hydrogenase small subunit|uniref:NADH-quinone oxidoreductase subunit B family protein n=1 Tax=unclassified Chloroflexus TaxID=2633855 RepID=UPI0004DF749A|nr:MULTISPECIES: oxidoreductase [unclassified Chloroflexus]MBO9348825.1 oxidoreductase [Chloroflexus sp.]MDN5270996.1 oxidoreductase [Chloroflexus sp. MS-CIW-1]